MAVDDENRTALNGTPRIPNAGWDIRRLILPICLGAWQLHSCVLEQKAELQNAPSFMQIGRGDYYSTVIEEVLSSVLSAVLIVAVIVTEPAATPVTTPELLTVAYDVELEVQPAIDVNVEVEPFA